LLGLEAGHLLAGSVPARPGPLHEALIAGKELLHPLDAQRRGSRVEDLAAGVDEVVILTLISQRPHRAVMRQVARIIKLVVSIAPVAGRHALVGHAARRPAYERPLQPVLEPRDARAY